MTNLGRWRMALAEVLLIALAGTASAQARWGSEPMPRAGVCFFADVNLSGQYFCARPGETIGALPPEMADRISSMRVIGPVGVTVFRDVRFRGPSARFETDVRDLRRQGWNDQISSLRVGTVSGEWNGNRPPVWGHAPTLREGACFYSDVNFRGQSFCMPRGSSYVFVPPGFNDRISSIRVMGAAVMIFADRDFSGRATRFGSNVVNLGGSWNDRISSIRVF